MGVLTHHPFEIVFKKKTLFSGFEVKKQHFKIVEGLVLCSIIYQIRIIFMAFQTALK